MRWEHLNLKEAYVEIPAPKGGEARAFRCALTPPMIRSLERVRRASNVPCDLEHCRPWVCPSAGSRIGNVEEVKNRDLITAHTLRDARFGTSVQGRRSVPCTRGC